MYLLRGRAGTERLGGGAPPLWHQPNCRGQAAALCRGLLDAGSPCRRWRCDRRDLPRTGHQARLWQRRLGLDNRLSSGGRKLMNGRHGIRVRGRDFTGYRIAGAIVALIFLVFLIWQLVYLFQGYKVVVPQVGWETSSTVTGIEDSLSAPASGSLATAVLRDRTTLMEGRENVGPAPGLTPPPMALDYAGLLDTRRLHLRDRTLPRSWSIPDDVARQIMRPSEKVIGWTAAPYTNAALFERPEGRTWRHAMADWAQHY